MKLHINWIYRVIPSTPGLPYLIAQALHAQQYPCLFRLASVCGSREEWGGSSCSPGQAFGEKNSKVVPQVLVQWSNVPVTSSTWEDFYVVRERFPHAITQGQA